MNGMDEGVHPDDAWTCGDQDQIGTPFQGTDLRSGTGFPVYGGSEAQRRLALPRQLREWTPPGLTDEEDLREPLLHDLDRVSLEGRFREEFGSEPRDLQQGLYGFLRSLPIRGAERIVLEPREDPENPDVVRYLVRVECSAREDEDLFELTEKYAKHLTRGFEDAGALDRRSRVYIQVTPHDAER